MIDWTQPKETTSVTKWYIIPKVPENVQIIEICLECNYVEDERSRHQALQWHKQGIKYLG
jgi:hypothetical protein